MSAQKSCNLNLRALRYPQESRNTQKIDGDQSMLLKLKIKAMEYRNCTANPELIGMHSLIEGALANSDCSGKKIAVITDSELGKLEQFNNREIPLFDQCFLPENFTLIYASADKKNDSLYSRLISECDAVAKEILNHIASGSNISHDLMASPNSHFSHFRQWIQEDAE